MQVFVHDRLPETSPHRSEFIEELLAQALQPVASAVHRVEVSLVQEGHRPDSPEIHCHLTAAAGSLGVVVADSRNGSVHQSVSEAVERLVRGLRRRIGQREARRNSSRRTTEVLSAE